MIKVIEKNHTIGLVDLTRGGAVLIDKPIDWTSFDVVNKLRYAIGKALQIKKNKVGHAGTLDPKATGLLILCFGSATKGILTFQNLHKEYTGEFFIGATTPTYDSESEINVEFPIEHITEAKLLAATKEFFGQIDQYPPIYSAIKKHGIPLYKRARAGEEVELKKRQVTIDTFELTGTDLPLVSFRAICQKGTYIRSLAYDYGKALNSGAYLYSLRRTKIGSYDVKNAWRFEDLCERITSTNTIFK